MLKALDTYNLLNNLLIFQRYWMTVDVELAINR